MSDGDRLTATGLASPPAAARWSTTATAPGNYTPAANDDTQVTFSYTDVSDGGTAAGSARLDITPVNDAADDYAGDAGGDRRGQRRADHPGQLLVNAADVDGALARGLAIATGSGSLQQRQRHLELYAGRRRRHRSASATPSRRTRHVAGTPACDITPVNDAPMTSPVTLTAIAEDSGARLITQAELLANATDVDGAPLTGGLGYRPGSGTLVNNGNGTWNYTPALNDATAVSSSPTP